MQQVRCLISELKICTTGKTYFFFDLNRRLNRLLFLLCISCFPFLAEAVIVTGRVTDALNKPLPFANVYIRGTTHGTNTNDEGIYVLNVEPGTYEIIFKYLGYKTVTRSIVAGTEKIVLDVSMEIENYQLAEIVIKADAEDPAYAMIRKAQKKRKYYLDQVHSFSCDAYIKGVQKLTKYPKKFLGQDIDFEGMLDTVTGIIYLSESVSKFYFKRPDLTKETMISSKVSGDNKAFSFNQNAMMQYNFYNNIVGQGVLGDRGFISPVAASAMLYYRYKLIGTFTDNNQQVEKIEVIPIRPSDPAFRGFIYITDSTWRIHSLDLYLTRESQVKFVDTLHLEQVYLPVGGHQDIWMPVSNKFSFSFNLFGFVGNGTFLGINSNFEINPDLDKHFFDGEVLKINKDANKMDMNYWMNLRPVPLTQEESVDYSKKDSMQVIRESKPYKDSLDRQSNRIKAGKLLLTGYRYQRRFKNEELNFSPLIQNIEYNTVEGLRIRLAADYTKTFENKTSWSFSPEAAYGFANKTFQGTGRLRYNYNPRQFAHISIEGGQDAVQYNNQKPILPVVNSSYTLLAEQNYMKIYEKRFAILEHKTEVTNGIQVSSRIEYSDRLPMVNHTVFTLVDVKDRRFISNDPKFPGDTLNRPPFARSQSFSAQVQVRLRLRQKYISRPDNKFIMGSKYPTLLLLYRKAFPGILGSGSDYDFVRATVEDEMNLGMLGTTSYTLSYGNFIRTRKIGFISYQHFSGNLTVISSFKLNSFNLLDYYTYSTPEEYVEGHLEHNFNGFILNKIPYVRKLKLNEVVGFHYLYVRNKPAHYEYAAGLQKLGLVRIDFVSAWEPHQKPRYGFRIGISILGSGR